MYVELEKWGRIGLSSPSKMPGYSWALQAGTTCPASKATVSEFGDRAICAGCYAKGGAYVWAPTVAAQDRRLAWLRHELREGGNGAVEVLTSLVRRATKREKAFRVHDSGDLFSPAYADVWRRVALALPEVQFWIPTREYLREHMLPSLRALAALPNVALRPSAAALGQPAPEVEGLDAGTAVVPHGETLVGHWICPSTATEKKACDDHGCRKCWDPTVRVAYVAHGGLKGRSLPVVK